MRVAEKIVDFTSAILGFGKANRRGFVMFKSRKIVLPTPEENAEINRGIAADPDTYELSSEEFRQLRPLSETVAAKRMGQPPLDALQEMVRIPPDADVLAKFKAGED